MAEGLQDPLDLPLHHEDHRVVAQAGVGAQQHEGVGEARHGEAQVGAGSAVPGLGEIPALQPGQAQAAEGIVDGEAGTPDQHVELVVIAALEDHAGLVDGGDGRGAQRHVVAGHGGQVPVVDEDPLTAWAVGGCERPCEVGVPDLAPDVCDEQTAEDTTRPAVGGEGGGVGELVAQVDAQALQQAQGRHVAEEPALHGGEGPVALGHDPGWGALEDHEPRGLLGHLRHELDGTGTRADDADALAGQSDGGVPPGRVHGGTREGLGAGNGRDAGVLEGAGAGDQEAGVHHQLIGAAEGPAAGLLVEAARQDLGTEAHEPAQLVALDQVEEVALDLGATGVVVTPVGVGRKGQRVEVAGHITGHARVGVVPPGATDVVGPLEDDEVLGALLEEADRGRDAREAGPDDGDVGLDCVHER